MFFILYFSLAASRSASHLLNQAEEASNKMSLRMNRFWDLRHRVSWHLIVEELGQWKCGRHECLSLSRTHRNLFLMTGWGQVDSNFSLKLSRGPCDGVSTGFIRECREAPREDADSLEVLQIQLWPVTLCCVDSSRSCHIFSWDSGWFISAFGRRFFCSPGFWKLPSRLWDQGPKLQL